MSEISDKIRMTVDNYFKQSYNCERAIVQVFGKKVSAAIDDNDYCLYADFGGERGHARDLISYKFNTSEHLINCLKLTNKIGKLLVEFIEEKELLPAVIKS